MTLYELKKLTKEPLTIIRDYEYHIQLHNIDLIIELKMSCFVVNPKLKKTYFISYENNELFIKEAKTISDFRECRNKYINKMKEIEKLKQYKVLASV